MVRGGERAGGWDVGKSKVIKESCQEETLSPPFLMSC